MKISLLSKSHGYCTVFFYLSIAVYIILLYRIQDCMFLFSDSELSQIFFYCLRSILFVQGVFAKLELGTGTLKWKTKKNFFFGFLNEILCSVFKRNRIIPNNYIFKCMSVLGPIYLAIFLPLYQCNGASHFCTN